MLKLSTKCCISALNGQGTRCWISALNAQGSRGSRTSWAAHEKRKIGRISGTIKIDGFLSFTRPWMLGNVLHGRFFWISPCVWPNSGYWCCLFLTLGQYTSFFSVDPFSLSHTLSLSLSLLSSCFLFFSFFFLYVGFQNYIQTTP
jgi:hypothetical protein